MRVIAGKYRSRILRAPQGPEPSLRWDRGGPAREGGASIPGSTTSPVTRPTSDRLRETLFNVLAPRMEGAVFVDLYAGSGAVGIEAISRGAREAIFVEQAEAALKAIGGNLASLGIRGGYALEARSAAAGLRRLTDAGRQADIVFLDPPYAAAAEYERTLGLLGGESSGLLASGAVVIAEHDKRRDLEERYGILERYRVLKQGDAALSFYRTASSAMLG